jgi:hypothetical protein
MNLNETIAPKSDQLNADDLIGGPKTIKITDVRAGSGPEQPVSIYFDGDNGRPYKPGKSMRRVLVAIWGGESTAPYIGRSLTLYCDPSITFGPDTTGGIRISHATDISGPVTVALTVKRGKRKPFVVQPLVIVAPKPAAPALTADDLLPYEQTGDDAAKEGSEALKSFWLGLPKPVQAALNDKKNNVWKNAAANADKK